MYDRVTSYHENGLFYGVNRDDGTGVDTAKLPPGWEAEERSLVTKKGFHVRTRSFTHQQTGTLVTEKNELGLTVDYHPGKVLKNASHNLYIPRNQEELDQAEKLLEEMLQPFCKLGNKKKYRYVEITADVHVKTSVIMQLLQDVRHPKLKNWNHYGGSDQEGISYGSKGKNSCLLQFYNKIKEMKRRRKGKHLGELVRHMTRIELALKGKKVSEYFGSAELQSLRYDQARSILLDELSQLDAKLIPLPTEKCTGELRFLQMLCHPDSGLSESLVKQVYQQYLQQQYAPSTIREKLNGMAALRQALPAVSLRELVEEATSPESRSSSKGEAA